jgi:hypothetical protein
MTLGNMRELGAAADPIIVLPLVLAQRSLEMLTPRNGRELFAIRTLWLASVTWTP